MTNDDKLDVYISCSKKDQEIVEGIGARLMLNQVKYWYVLRTLILPMEQIRATDTAIEKCQIVVVLLTSNYAKDVFCHSDIRKAYDNKKPIIVFSMENIDFPETLNSIYKLAPRDKKTTAIVPVNAWENSLENSVETLIQTVLIFLKRTEKQKQFAATLNLDYYNNYSKSEGNPKRNLQVFLCHSSSDKPAVENFYNILINDGVDAWLDKKNLIPGQDWKIEIPKAVRNSDVVIVFLSSSSITKEGFVQKEIKIALDTADEKPDGTIFIIPAKLENCEVPERLAKFHWVNLFEKDGYELLFKALQTRASSLDVVINRTT
jgi:hypothetical protein